MHELGRVDDLVGLGGHFGAYPGEAAVARLEVGDADHVVIGHGARDLLGRGRGERVCRHLGEGIDAIEVFAPVGDVLEIHDARQAGRDHAVHRLGQLARALDQGVEAGVADRLQLGKLFPGGVARWRGRRRLQLRHGRVVGAAEGTQARLDADARFANRRLVGGARERQGAGGRQGAEQGRRDHALRLLGDGRHVEGEELLARRARRFVDLGGIAGAVAGRDLLADRIGAVRRGDERRAIGRDQPALHGAARLHQLGADHDVDLAGHRHQRQHGTAARAVGFNGLDVVDRGARALGDAGHRRRLRQPALPLDQRHDPVDQHAAALAAHRHHRDGGRPSRVEGWRGDDGVHRVLRPAAAADGCAGAGRSR